MNGSVTESVSGAPLLLLLLLPPPPLLRNREPRCRENTLSRSVSSHLSPVERGGRGGEGRERWMKMERGRQSMRVRMRGGCASVCCKPNCARVCVCVCVCVWVCVCVRARKREGEWGRKNESRLFILSSCQHAHAHAQARLSLRLLPGCLALFLWGKMILLRTKIAQCC